MNAFAHYCFYSNNGYSECSESNNNIKNSKYMYLYT